MFGKNRNFTFVGSEKKIRKEKRDVKKRQGRSKRKV
jgi:hypothetical protein